jgi:hypothetical protein
MNPSPNTNQYRIVKPEGLMSSDPNLLEFWNPHDKLRCFVHQN